LDGYALKEQTFDQSLCFSNKESKLVSAITVPEVVWELPCEMGDEKAPVRSTKEKNIVPVQIRRFVVEADLLNCVTFKSFPFF
jgi:hypothetical protein